MKASRLSTFILVTAVGLAGLGAPAAQTTETKLVTNENRLFQRFIEDGAVTDNVWLEGQFRYQSTDARVIDDGDVERRDADIYSLGAILAVNVAEDLEFGGQLGFRTLNPDPGDPETGLTDLDLYGKIRFTTEPTQVAAGILLKLPTGDEDESPSFGTGEVDVAFFGGVRHDFGRSSLVASFGLRINQDPEPDLDPNVPGLEGETSISLGGGYLLALTSNLVGVIEASYETERIDRSGSDFRLTLGADYRRGKSFGIRGAVVGGLGDFAPDLEIVASGVFYF
jgi:hypothetical protein